MVASKSSVFNAFSASVPERIEKRSNMVQENRIACAVLSTFVCVL